ncbi:polysaccharide deacetylase family protein [Sporosarcina sp. NCCP-2222]|uniref:polysaccharide deacetylase family protein n=1 Tax=Sporosarcina sp. NCCP-2222 TaxID=2935073 RepID=UPI0020BDFD1A|nr:polysaccharide deacetylase family protein [Sporosarcina sp. NCCP-2222]
MDCGIFIISLDFELNWGVHDVFTLQEYGQHLLGGRKAIGEILSLFQKYDIHATWATVGMLCFDEKETLETHMPMTQPSYENPRFSPYGKLANIGGNEETDPYHFGESIVQQILQVPHQEIGTHTFSHFYCLEKGQTADQFKADLEAALSVPCLNELPIRSLVFPRNQVNPRYLPICEAAGIESYRGNEENWLYEPTSYASRGSWKRVLRLMDCYVNLTGHHTYRMERSNSNEPINLRSSRFLRPYHPMLHVFEPLRLKRINKAIEYAAEKREIYHLWWHPHNFGTNTAENLMVLEEILQHVDKMRQVYGMQSANMAEAAEQIGKLQRNP